MKLKLIEFLLWLIQRLEDLRVRLDVCCVPGCDNEADFWCISGGHRACYEHNSHFYNDADLCTVCYDSMTPEEMESELAYIAEDGERITDDSQILCETRFPA